MGNNPNSKKINLFLEYYHFRFILNIDNISKLDLNEFHSIVYEKLNFQTIPKIWLNLYYKEQNRIGFKKITSTNVNNLKNNNIIKISFLVSTPKNKRRTKK